MGRSSPTTALGTNSGASTLRILREQARLSQVDVEIAAELGEHYLNRIERGLIDHPKRQTLERILDALHATYNDRRHILESYGYTVANPLPSNTEIAAAQASFDRIIAHLLVPAQLLDCAQRLLAWNPLLDHTIGQIPGNYLSSPLIGRSIFEITFNPQFHVRQRILNLIPWSQHMLPVTLYELRPYMQEAWCQHLLKEIGYISDGINNLPKDLREERRIPARPLIPIMFQGPDALALSFFIATESFIDDSRFRITYYLPADETTHHIIHRWANEFVEPFLLNRSILTKN